MRRRINIILFLALVLLFGQAEIVSQSLKYDNNAPEFLNIIANVSNPSGTGVCDGSISLTVSQGTPPFTFFWSNGDSSSFIGNLCEGIYTVYVQDSFGSSDSATYVLTAVSNSLAFSLVVQNVTCHGYSDGFAFFNVSPLFPPYSYFWSTGNTSLFSDSLSAGIYSVTVSDSLGTDSVVTFEITEPDPVSCSFITSGIDPVSDSGGSILANPTGGTSPYNFLWSNGSISAAVDPASYGEYSVLIIDNNGCTAYFDELYIDFAFLPNWSMDQSPDSGFHLMDFSGASVMEIFGTSITKNDFIGAFYDSAGIEVCGGYLVWQNSVTSIQLLADVFGTTGIEGFDNSDEIKWKIWDASKNEEYEAVASYNPAFDNSGLFNSGSVSLIDSLQVFELSGYAYDQNSSLLSSGYALLYRKAESGFFPVAVKELNQGNFIFQGIHGGDYLVQVYPDGTNDNLLPVYVGNAIEWNQVSTVVCEGKTTGIDINLKEPVSFSTGNGRIGGTVSVGEDASYDPDFYESFGSAVNEQAAVHILVYLFNESHEILAYDLTNESGVYSFDDLAFGNYFVRVEKPGLNSDSVWITLNNDVPVYDFVNFRLDESMILQNEQIRSDDVFMIYPNPAENILHVQSGRNQRGGTVSIYSVNGRCLFRNDMMKETGLSVDVDAFSKGVYIVEMNDGKLKSRQKLIIL